MALTRAIAEAVLVKRLGTLFTAMGLDGTTVAGTNADLADPISYALRVCGYTVANVSAPTSAEVAAVAVADEEAFLDYAELRGLESAHSAAMSLTDVQVGPRRESMGQTAQRLEARVAAKRAQVEAVHGKLTGTLSGGVLTLDFAEVEES